MSFTPARRFTFRRIVAAAVLLIVLAYGGAILWLMSRETAIVFKAGAPLGASRPTFPYEQIDVPRGDGAAQIAWKMPHPDARTWVLFLHGNAATIAARVNIARYRELRGLGLSVFAPEYRGFAGLPGIPSEAALVADARAAFDHLTTSEKVPPTRIVIYGWSLGSAVAVQLASQVGEAAVILEGAPASLVTLGQQEYPLFPIRLIMRNPFESIQRIDRIAAPILFIHSPEDNVIPIAEGRRLYEAARPPKRFVEVKGGHVYANDVDKPAFFGAIRSFLDEYGLLGHQE